MFPSIIACILIHSQAAAILQEELAAIGYQLASVAKGIGHPN